jgi:hypothetical protein
LIIGIESDATGVRVATLKKSRDSASGTQVRFVLEAVPLDATDSFGDRLTTVVVQPATGLPIYRARPSGQRQRELLVELERRYRTGERSWDEATIRKAGRDLGMPRNSPSDAIRGLMQAGYLVGSAGSISLKYPPEQCTK